MMQIDGLAAKEDDARPARRLMKLERSIFRIFYRTLLLNVSSSANSMLAITTLSRSKIRPASSYNFYELFFAGNSLVSLDSLNLIFGKPFSANTFRIFRGKKKEKRIRAKIFEISALKYIDTKERKRPTFIFSPPPFSRARSSNRFDVTHSTISQFHRTRMNWRGEGGLPAPSMVGGLSRKPGTQSP